VTSQAAPDASPGGRGTWLTWLVWAAAAVVTVCAGVLGTELADRWSVAGGALFVSALGLLLWPVLHARTDAFPHRWVLFIILFTGSSVLPGQVSAPLQGVALVGAVIEWFRIPAAQRRGPQVVFCSLLILAFWAALVFHPNIPSLTVGLLGFRKTVLAFAGLIAGCAVPSRHVRRAELLIVSVLAGSLVVSIVIHLVSPAAEQIVTRAAAASTASFGGEARLQGIFAGPFHVAIAGVFLFGWALVRFQTYRGLALLAGGVGLVAVYLTLVRTAYVACVVVLLAYLLLSGSAKIMIRRSAQLAALLGAIAAVWLAAGGRAGNVVDSIAGAATDQRFLNRFPGYEQGFRMIEESPFWGWGAGSAGDTLGTWFGPGRLHVTPHNVALKVAVEGGLIGLALCVLLFVYVISSIDRKSDGGKVAILGLVALGVMGSTVSATEALPVSYLILCVVGLAVRHTEGLARWRWTGSRRPMESSVSGPKVITPDAHIHAGAT
jgi:O-antigen ligase